MNNKLFKDIFLILIIGSLLGLAYNFYSNKLEWVRTEKPIITISEDELFGSEVNNYNTNQSVSKDTSKSILSDSVRTEKQMKDTLITQNQIKEKPRQPNPKLKISVMNCSKNILMISECW